MESSTVSQRSSDTSCYRIDFLNGDLQPLPVEEGKIYETIRTQCLCLLPWFQQVEQLLHRFKLRKFIIIIRSSEKKLCKRELDLTKGVLSIIDHSERRAFEAISLTHKDHDCTTDMVMQGNEQAELIKIAGGLAQQLVRRFQVDGSLIPQPQSVSRFHNIFHGTLYERFLFNLRTNIQALIKREIPNLEKCTDEQPQIEKEGVALVKAIFTADRKKPERRLQAHGRIFDLLRSLMNQLDKNPQTPFVDQVRTLVDEVITFMFAESNLRHAWWAFICSKLPAFPDMTKPLWKIILEVEKQLAANPVLNGSTKFLPSSDFYIEGDIPSFLWTTTHPDGSKTQFMRTSMAATLDPHLNHGIIPELHYYLSRLTESHIYFCLVGFDSEQEATYRRQIDCLEALPSTKLFRFIRDGIFYHQTDEYGDEIEGMTDLETFPGVILEGLFAHYLIPSFEWSGKVDKNNLKHNATRLFYAVMKHYLKNMKTLNAGQRNVLMELFLVIFAVAMIDRWKPRSCNFTCVRTHDRGASFTAAVKVFMDHRAGRPIDYTEILSLYFGPAVTGDNRIPHTQRTMMLSHFVHVVLSHPPFHFVWEDNPSVEAKQDKQDVQD